MSTSADPGGEISKTHLSCQFSNELNNLRVKYNDRGIYYFIKPSEISD